WFADVKRSADQDPVGTAAWMAQQYGLHPMQLAQQIAQRYQNQPMQAQSQQVHDQRLAAMERTVAEFEAANPRLNDLDAEVIEILNTPQFQKSNQPPHVKLKAALDLAVKRDKSGSLDEKLERSMRRVANRRGLK